MPPVWDLENKQYSNIAFLEAGIEEQPSTWKVITAVFAAGWFTYSIYSTAAGLWKWLGSKLEERNKRLVEQVAQQVQRVQRAHQAQNGQADQRRVRRRRRAWTKNM